MREATMTKTGRAGILTIEITLIPDAIVCEEGNGGNVEVTFRNTTSTALEITEAWIKSEVSNNLNNGRWILYILDSFGNNNTRVSLLPVGETLNIEGEASKTERREYVLGGSPNNPHSGTGTVKVENISYKVESTVPDPNIADEVIITTP
jgi:hypothetical protein